MYESVNQSINQSIYLPTVGRRDCPNPPKSPHSLPLYDGCWLARPHAAIVTILPDPRNHCLCMVAAGLGAACSDRPDLARSCEIPAITSSLLWLLAWGPACPAAAAWCTPRAPHTARAAGAGPWRRASAAQPPARRTDQEPPPSSLAPAVAAAAGAPGAAQGALAKHITEHEALIKPYTRASSQGLYP